VEVVKRLRPGEVVASNLHTVAHLVGRCGCIATTLDIAGDNLDNLTAVIQRGTEADVVVTTGGTGKGDKDLVSTAVISLNGDLRFRGVAMTPGKQMLFARLGETLLFGLPGRPAATYIAFEQLVRPALLRMHGVSRVLLPEITARLSRPIQVTGKVLSFLFCRMILGPDGPEVRSLRSETKGIFTEMLAANGLLRIPPGRDRLDKGELVQVQLLDLGLDAFSYFPVT
jgi:molybdopterin molybdotransferase